MPGYKTSHNISNFRNANVVFHDYPGILTPTDNIHKCRLGKITFPRIVFEPDMLFQVKHNAFLRNTTNKNTVVNVISTEFKKALCKGFDDTDTGVTKLVFQSSWKCLTTVIA